MIDRIFSAALTFCLLIGGTLAIGSAFVGLDRPAAAPSLDQGSTRPVRPMKKRIPEEKTLLSNNSRYPLVPR